MELRICCINPSIWCQLTKVIIGAVNGLTLNQWRQICGWYKFILYRRLFHRKSDSMEMYFAHSHYNDIIMNTMASQITSLAIVYSTVYSSADQRKHQSSASLAIVRGIHRWPVSSLRKGQVTRKMFPFDDVIMLALESQELPWCQLYDNLWRCKLALCHQSFSRCDNAL